MAGVQGAGLGGGGSRGGALGSLPCAMLSQAALESELQVPAAHQDARFNLNFFCHTQAQPEPGARTCLGSPSLQAITRSGG